MKKYDYCIVGAGIIGLATALAIIKKTPKAQILILEKETGPGVHQTGHNSGVIHAGIYYAPDSLKAILCRQGLHETKEFCKQSNINYQECGKLIVATNEVERARIEGLYQRGLANGLQLERVSAAALSKREPNISGVEALFSPETSIVDYKLMSLRLADRLGESGVLIRYGEEVVDICENDNQVLIKTKFNQAVCEKLIVCGGLQSERLLKLSGIDPDYKIVPFRGEYFRLVQHKTNIVNHLIYPAPDPDLPFLGVHLTKMIGGYVTVGPNAVIGFSREGYEKWSFNLKDTADFLFYSGFWKLILKHRKSALNEFYGAVNVFEYLKQCQKYCPSLSVKDFLPYRAGIRAQAVSADGELIHDFMFKHTKRVFHVCNAPSPAATSALPIGRMIAEKCH